MSNELTTPIKIEIPGIGTIESADLYLKSEVDKFISDLEESHEKKVGQLLMKIAGLEKLVETANKLLEPKGGFTVKDITFNGVKLEGFKKEVTNAVDKSNA